jgi:hypothetical protein
MLVLECEQGSEEWHKARAGVPSASNFSKLITAAGKPSTSAEAYINSLIAYLITGTVEESYKNEHMARGNLLEPQARAMYELTTDNVVTEVGFCLHDTIMAGCSPDGLVGDNGGLEIKCPSASTHVGYLRSKKLPVIYKQQVMGCLWITGREWWDFMSFHPEMEDLIVRVYRDDEYINVLADVVNSAADVILTESKKLRRK